MISFLRIRRIFFGASALLIALGSALYLISALFVVVSFGGTAGFPVECGVVFGSAVRNSREAGPGITRRVETAVHLAKEGSIERLFFTGGTGEGNDLSEARVMRNVALKMGLDPDRIRLEEGATSTWQNVQFMLPYLRECKTVVGISDRYHLGRIRLTAWKQGQDIQVYPADRIAPFEFELTSVLREALGVLVYGVLFNIY